MTQRRRCNSSFTESLLSADLLWNVNQMSFLLSLSRKALTLSLVFLTVSVNEFAVSCDLVVYYSAPIGQHRVL